MRLFIGASYASVARYLMDDCNVIDIGLRVIKHCGMYSKEYKNWIACKNESPPIREMINSFKEYWANAITLVNQTAAPASRHGYSMAAMDNDTLITSYGESLANFGAAYAATQESMKAQATTMAAMQDQLTNIQQFCMAVGQQPPPNIYAPAQQQHTFNRCRDRRNGGGHSNSGVVVAATVGWWWQRWCKFPTTSLVWWQWCQHSTTPTQHLCLCTAAAHFQPLP